MAFSPRQLIRYDVAKLQLSASSKSKIRKVISENTRSGRITDLTLRNALCDELGSRVGMNAYNSLKAMRSDRKGQKKRPGLFSGLFGGGK